MKTDTLDCKIHKTALHESHQTLNAKMVPFGGFKMPVSYADGIQSEYFAVRNDVGIFDVSHMGEFIITGNNALEFLQKVTINDVSKLNVGQAQYSAMCYPDGGIVDDLILYRKSDSYFMVVNAANIQKDFDWISQHIPNDTHVEDISSNISLVALQGPRSRELLSKFTDDKLKMPFYSFKEASICGFSTMLSRTGYTGELGFEIYASEEAIINIWDEMVNAGYDSWSPSDNIRVDGSMFNTGGTDFTPILGGALPYLTSTAVDTRSDWQKWKDSFKEDWKAK